MVFPAANFGPFLHYDTADEISKGNVAGSTELDITGVNHNMLADTREDLWPKGGTLVYLPTAETMVYESSDEGDTNGLFISGNLAGVTVTENVTLTGTTPVAGGQLFDVINFMFLTSGETNIGAITATASSALTPQCGMFQGRGISQHGFYRVPLGKNVIFKQIALSAARQAAGQTPIINFNMFVRFAPTTPWISLIDIRMDTGVQSGGVVPYPLSGVVFPGADIRFSAISTEADTEISVRLVAIEYAV
jgi:hypothetical protein